MFLYDNFKWLEGAMLLKICFLKILVTEWVPCCVCFTPFTNGSRISDMVTLGVMTTALPLVLPKHRFCWGQLSPAAAPPPDSPPFVSRRRRSQDSGGTGWLCGHYPETLCLRWYSAERNQEETRDNSEKTSSLIHTSTYNLVRFDWIN